MDSITPWRSLQRQSKYTERERERERERELISSLPPSMDILYGSHYRGRVSRERERKRDRDRQTDGQTVKQKERGRRRVTITI